MSKQKLLSQLIKAISNDNDVKKIKVKYKNGEVMVFKFDNNLENDKNHDDVIEDENMVKVDKDKNDDYINDEDEDDDDDDDDDELEDETVVDVDKDDYEGYIDDDDDDDEGSYS